MVLDGEEVTEAVARAHQDEHLLALLFQKNGQVSKMGVVARVVQHWELSPSITGLLLEGLKRVEIERKFTEDGFKMAQVLDIEEKKVESEEESRELEALARGALEQFKRLLQMENIASFLVSEELGQEYLSPEKTSDIISATLKLDFVVKLELLETAEVRKRLETLNSKLANELDIAKTEKKIQQEIEKEVDQTQKEFLLKERLKAIEKELGIFEEQKEYDLLEQKILQASLPRDAETKVLGEIRRLRQMPPQSAEVPYLRTYLEWITDLPWSKKSKTTVDLLKAKEILDQDHYGLEKAKERVLEYLAVQKLTSDHSRGNILCFVGPPGTGKTSVGQSIAKALGRSFVRISLGGVRDEAEIRGHRRTYVGALPGRIIQGLRTAGTKNPVFMMDEIDKIGTDFRGDPAAALLEVLDPAQNNAFSDHYVEIPFDLSEVFFITTANILDPIPPALRDRLEVIDFPGYTDEEKFQIGKKFLLPRVLSSHGLSAEQLKVEEEALWKIIHHYTREAGVRELERKLSEIARKIAFLKASSQNIKREKQIVVVPGNLDFYLGPEEFELTMKEEKDEVGVATGLAWTPTGGEIILVEANLVTGKGNLTLTGQMGGVMQESARAALSYVRSRAKSLGFDENFYYKSDIHIHVPSGAVPKDGPSSGVAIATALLSVLTGRKAKKEVALTGEITLAGKVLKVGGVKEKVLAAERAGVTTVVMPKANEKNLVDVPKEARERLDLKFIKHMDEALDLALK